MTLLFLLGAILASYMYQLTSTTNINYNMFLSRSKCENCCKIILFRDLIPIISYLCLKGKCRFCKSRIPLDLFLCELILGTLFLIPLICNTPFDPLLYYFLVIFLIPLSIYDMKHYIIPNHVLIIMFITALVLFDMSLKGFLLSILILFLLHCVYFISNKSIGYGDLKLFSLLSIILSNSQFLLMFMFTFIIAGIFVLVYFCASKNLIKKVPLVPFITVSTLFVLIFNHQLNYYFLGGLHGH